MNIRKPKASTAKVRSQIDPAKFAKTLIKYRQPDNSRAVFELIVTVFPIIFLWVSIWKSLEISCFLAIAFAVPTAFFLVRLFMIQHDCGHGSFFTSRRLNDWTGRIIGVFTLTPYGFWRTTHALHHAGSGCLEKRGYGDIDTLTISEYRERPFWGRLKYRLYRHPLVMFGVGPTYLFVLQHRLPVGLMRSGWRPWLSTMGTNAAIAICVLVAIYFFGVIEFSLMYFPVMLLAASLGVWLFFVQHQFELTSWDSDPEWKWHEAAMHGSSHYDLPPVLQWLTANIGIHHVHHLCSRIPFYKLPTVIREFPELKDVSRLTLWESLSCVKLVLWDEDARRLVSFRQAQMTV